MRKTKWLQYGLLLGMSVLLGFTPVGAQEEGQDAEQGAGQEEPAAAVTSLDALQVVGSRLPGRSAQDSSVPVDVIQGEDLQTYGIRDMDSLLSAAVPSYNVNRHPISDGSTFVRPANLHALLRTRTFYPETGSGRLGPGRSIRSGCRPPLAPA